MSGRTLPPPPCDANSPDPLDTFGDTEVGAAKGNRLASPGQRHPDPQPFAVITPTPKR